MAEGQQLTSIVSEGRCEEEEGREKLEGAWNGCQT